MKLDILSNDRIRDYFRTADSGLFLRRAGDFGSHDSHKNARENRELIPKNPAYLGTQIRCQKNCMVVALKVSFPIICDYLRKNPPRNECAKCHET